jgi:hypothetical protein
MGVAMQPLTDAAGAEDWALRWRANSQWCIRWIVLTAAVWALGGGAIAALGLAVEPAHAAAAVGTAVGLVQWRMIVTRVPDITAVEFVLPSALGWAVTVAVELSLMAEGWAGAVWEWGGLIGAAQAWAMRGKLPWTRYWILAMTAAGLLVRGSAIAPLPGSVNSVVPWPVVASILCALLGTLYALPTAVYLVAVLPSQPATGAALISPTAEHARA